eukprot:255713-Pelagomonas_calceolata.AAC.1
MPFWGGVVHLRKKEKFVACYCLVAWVTSSFTMVLLVAASSSYLMTLPGCKGKVESYGHLQLSLSLSIVGRPTCSGAFSCFLPPVLKALAMEAAINLAWLQWLWHRARGEAGTTSVSGAGCPPPTVFLADLAAGTAINTWRAFLQHGQGLLCQPLRVAGAVPGRPPGNCFGAQKTFEE